MVVAVATTIAVEYAAGVLVVVVAKVVVVAMAIIREEHHGLKVTEVEAFVGAKSEEARWR